jgi:hypothetical protein
MIRGRCRSFPARKTISDALGDISGEPERSAIVCEKFRVTPP